MNKATRNYWVDLVIGVAFVVVAISSIAFLVPLSWIDFTVAEAPSVMGVHYGVWQVLHKWAGIAMLIGVVVHGLLHWGWITSMTQRVLGRKASKEEK